MEFYGENRVVLPTNINILDRNRPRRIVFYGRVSTEHEDQLSALENQLQWYDDQAKYHSNWTVLRKYIDEGITGTQAKKRPAFLEMLADARQKKFDLIVTREVCRFARNTVDTLVTTRELKNYGVEVYFVEDNIWTMDGDGEMRLTIMATLAQEESRKTSERVRAGQKISRDNGVLYGNGNILGYERVGNTYIINEEQAETVRIIYNLYLQGYGFQKIVNELIRLKRKDASGLVRWECTKVSRILHNATYKGYMGYLKSWRNNYLDQKVIINHNEDTYLYVKGNFEPIISEEIWDSCKEMRERKIQKIRSASGVIKGGIRRSDDIWVKKMVCRCGYHFRKDKWHFNKSGVTYGYKCYNQLNNGSKRSREEAGLPSEQFCDIGAVADWKMDMMVWYIFSKLCILSKDVIKEAYNIFKQCSVEEQPDNSSEIEENLKLLEKEKSKLDNLTEMRMEGEITKEEYQIYKVKVSDNIIKIENRISELKQQEINESETYSKVISFEEFNFMLNDCVDLSKPKLSENVIGQLVSKIVPNTELDFKWYLNLFPHKTDKEFSEVFSFQIDFLMARDYRRMRNEILRPNQWRDLTITIYI